MLEARIQEALNGCRLPAWETIPDFGLYMDQVLTYVERNLPSLSGLPGLTAPMINNYVKAGLVDRPDGKKYSRSAVARLLMICVLKQTMSQDGIRRLLRPGEGTEEIYAAFRSSQDRIIGSFSDAAPASALACALESASLHLICRLMLAEDTAEKAP